MFILPPCLSTANGPGISALRSSGVLNCSKVGLIWNKLILILNSNSLRHHSPRSSPVRLIALRNLITAFLVLPLTKCFFSLGFWDLFRHLLLSFFLHLFPINLWVVLLLKLRNQQVTSFLNFNYSPASGNPVENKTRLVSNVVLDQVPEAITIPVHTHRANVVLHRLEVLIRLL